MFITMVWVFVAISSICEFGERLSGTFNEINNVCDQLAWHLFPHDVQQLLSFLFMIVQKPTELRVFGSISCSRITFQNVSRIVIFCHRIELISFTANLSTYLCLGDE